MGPLEFERRTRPVVGLNMTPLIDMVFLLLIFFILSSHFISEQGFTIKLPRAVHAQAHKNEHITVYIGADETIAIENDAIPLTGLQAALSGRLAGSASKTVVIKADEGVSLKLAVRVMDIARAADAGGLVISTRSDGDEDGA